MVSERPSRGLGGMSPRFPPREMRCRSTALRTLSHSVSAEWAASRVAFKLSLIDPIRSF